MVNYSQLSCHKNFFTLSRHVEFFGTYSFNVLWYTFCNKYLYKLYLYLYNSDRTRAAWPQPWNLCMLSWSQGGKEESEEESWSVATGRRNIEVCIREYLDICILIYTLINMYTYFKINTFIINVHTQIWNSGFCWIKQDLVVLAIIKGNNVISTTSC